MSLTDADRAVIAWTAKREHEAAFWHSWNLGNRAMLVLIGVVLGLGFGGMFWGMQ